MQEKLEVMKGKIKLRDRKKWITDDLRKKRKIKWLIKEKAEKKKREGKRVKIGYIKLWIKRRTEARGEALGVG